MLGDFMDMINGSIGFICLEHEGLLQDALRKLSAGTSGSLEGSEVPLKVKKKDKRLQSPLHCNKTQYRIGVIND